LTSRQLENVGADETPWNNNRCPWSTK